MFLNILIILFFLNLNNIYLIKKKHIFLIESKKDYHMIINCLFQILHNNFQDIIDSIHLKNNKVLKMMIFNLINLY